MWYPQDGTGRYQDAEGDVVEVDTKFFDPDETHPTIRVGVQLADGSVLHGYAHGPLAKYFAEGKVKRTTIRVYSAGGGRYPDNRITGGSM